MARTYSNMYNYGTSPRKIQPEYIPERRIREDQHKERKEQQNKKKLEEQARKKKQKKICMYIAIGFAVLFALSYRNSQIDERFSSIQSLQKELATVEKENEQLEVNIENGSNLNSLEQSAKELLGMQKLSNKQSVYVSLPKVDFIESEED